ncbi:hypothetical protein [Leucobacter ruminantium]|uniref:Uncharacterized protein n=1 Tax=Leucobacter ruminantium TaxID=1289170 RepID=A0A939RX92_9MICO|nr:hypothetical protein [Leucobacter ruminantium]MBO1805867.1 hypothetical protein [Leucobacter ruminantium]
MTRPTAKVRSQMYARDKHRCAATGRSDALTHQHRRAVGMGGSKIRPSITDSLTLSAEINERCERDLQVMALAYGWKVRKWVKDPSSVPVYYRWQRGWAVLLETGDAMRITPEEAAEMMRDIYGDDWDRWMSEINHEMPGGITNTGRS